MTNNYLRKRAGTQKWHLSVLARLVRNKLNKHCPESVVATSHLTEFEHLECN